LENEITWNTALHAANPKSIVTVVNPTRLFPEEIKDRLLSMIVAQLIFVKDSPQQVIAFSFSTRHDDTKTHHNPLDSSGRGISQLQRLPPAQHTQETNIHAPGGMPTRNPSKRTAGNPRLQPRSQ